jgi:hypothetical protein
MSQIWWGLPIKKIPSDANSKEIVHHRSRHKLNNNIKIDPNHTITEN